MLLPGPSGGREAASDLKQQVAVCFGPPIEAPIVHSGHISVNVSPSLIEKFFRRTLFWRFCSRENGLAPLPWRPDSGPSAKFLQVSSVGMLTPMARSWCILIAFAGVGKRGVDHDQAENYSKAQTNFLPSVSLTSFSSDNL